VTASGDVAKAVGKRKGERGKDSGSRTKERERKREREREREREGRGRKYCGQGWFRDEVWRRDLP